MTYTYPCFAVLLITLAGAPSTQSAEVGGLDLLADRPKPLSLDGLTNPVWSQPYNLRDPAVLPTLDGYFVYYSRLVGKNWGDPKSWTVACAFTKDFRTFTDDRDVSPGGFASPDAPVLWHGRYVLTYQSYPKQPVLLQYATSKDCKTWSDPQVFLEEAAGLPWNDYKRVIDPTLVVDGDTLHCFFIGSQTTTIGNPAKKPHKANILGHATTKDPVLKKWKILTKDAPLIGASDAAPDGVENVTLLKTGDLWTMIYSEGLEKQHLAYAQSPDLLKWELKGPIDIAVQTWMKAKYGAPFVWRDGPGWLMILMGQDPAGKTTFGLLSSQDGIHWKPLPERP